MDWAYEGAGTNGINYSLTSDDARIFTGEGTRAELKFDDSRAELLRLAIRSKSGKQEPGICYLVSEEYSNSAIVCSAKVESVFRGTIFVRDQTGPAGYAKSLTCVRRCDAGAPKTLRLWIGEDE